MYLSLNIRKIIFISAALVCLLPFMSAPFALLLGLILAQLITPPYLELNHKATHLLLKAAVVGLGFGMNVFTAMKVGTAGLLATVVSIIAVLSLGFLVGKLFKIDGKTSFLISAGTAICGGSAIAALSPIIKADQKELSISLGIIFILNSLALFIFPVVGAFFNLSQSQFGLWCAIAIHDTSSVVGAASRYGPEALQMATMVKLVRALWIIPLAFGTTYWCRGDKRSVQLPYFIGLFVLAMLANTYIPMVRLMAPYLLELAKRGLTLTLFFIGSGLSLQVIRSVGLKPFLQGVILWVGVSSLSLWAIISLF